MSTHRLGSVCIGIQGYADAHFAISEDKLGHAESDAAWFHEFCKEADTEPRPEDRHILLQGRAATRKEVERAFKTLAAGDYGLALIFFAGHGAVRDGVGWFSCADAEWNKTDISGPALDKLLFPIRARAVLVIVDCCYAASIAVGSSYFTSLPSGSVAHIFLGSSRANQRSWEADDIESGLFTYIVKKSLASPDAQDLVPFDSEIFRRLEKELPLLALRAKNGAAQEPVRIGVSTEELFLPHASRRLSVATESIRRTVLSLLRSAAYAFVAVSLAAIVATEYLTYHFAIDHEKIVVRLGIRELAWLIPHSGLLRVSTGISTDDLEASVFVGAGQSGRSLREAFQNENTNGMWLQKNQYGVRRWSTHLMNYLNGPASWKVQVNLTGRLPETLFDGTPSGPPNSLVTRAAALGVSIVPSSRWRGLVDLGKMSTACEMDSSSRQRPNMPSPDDIRSRLGTLREAAAVGIDNSFDLFVGAAREVATLMRDVDLDDAISMERALRDAMSAIATVRNVRGTPGVTAIERAAFLKLADSGCDPWIAISAILIDQDVQPWESRIEQLLSNAQANSLSIQEILGLDGALRLAQLDRQIGQAALSLLSLPSIPDGVLSLFRSPDGRWAVPAFNRQIALSWLHSAERSVGEGRFESAGSQLVLAASQATIFSDDELGRLRSLVGRGLNNDLSRREAEIANSYLTTARPIRPAELEGMISAVDWTQPILPFRNEGSLVLGGDQAVSGVELNAIGRAARCTGISIRGISQIYGFLSRNNRDHELKDLLYGLSAQRPWRAYRGDDAHGVVEGLISRIASRSDEDRALEVRLFAANTQAWLVSFRQAVLAELRLRWASEDEYEIRSSLADAIVALVVPQDKAMPSAREIQCQT